jgi:hypothetical protein
MQSFVCAVTSANIGSPTLFRTYNVPRGESYNCKIWEAARATSAAPTFFKPIKIGRENAEETFIDAALGCNNPVRQVLGEVELAFPGAPIACVVSIGTGQRSTIGLPKADAFQKWLPTKVIGVLQKLAVDSETTAEDLQKRFENVPGVYFRLNVEHGMQGITLEEWNKLGEVTTHTRKYLEKVKVSKEVDNIVKALIGESFSVPVSDLRMYCTRSD